MSNYISSITSRYGDVDKVKQDAAVLREILSRQGSELLLDVIASHTGEAAIKFKMNSNERREVVRSLIVDFKESLWQRM